VPGDPQVLQSQYEQCGKTVNRILLVKISLSFYCFLALSISDQSLMGLGAKIDLPFANFKMDYIYFLWIGPIVLMAVSLYMHIFISRLERLRLSKLSNTNAYIFTLDELVARALTSFLFYWLVPLVAWAFAAKGMFRPENKTLVIVSCLITSMYVLLQVKRLPEQNRFLKVLPRGMLLLFLLSIGSKVTNQDFALGRTVSMYGASLGGLDLRRFHVGNSYFERADFSQANLEGAFLDFAILTQAKLVNANLDLVFMPHADLREADLGRAGLFRGFLLQADFQKANLSSANLIEARLNETNFILANLEGAHLEGADLSFANFRQANLKSTVLDYATLRSTNLNNANLTGASLRHAVLWKTSLLHSEGLVQAQLNAACTYENTVLPEGLSLPKLGAISDCPSIEQMEGSDYTPGLFARPRARP
jgi:uncharacterized protein YjbI with pentapeptide repeats